MKFGVLVLGFLVSFVWGDGHGTAIPGPSETESEEGPTATYNSFVYPLLRFRVSITLLMKVTDFYCRHNC